MVMRRLRSLYRHPVKGLRPEPLLAALLSKSGMEGDRAFAFQFTDESVPAELRGAAPDTAPWMFKSHLAVQHDWPDLARIVPSWKPETQRLSLTSDTGQIEESVVIPEGRARLANFVQTFLSQRIPYAKARHPAPDPLRLIGSAGLTQRYTDAERGPVSLALTETMQDLETQFGFKIDERRFRLNIFLTGAPSWSELQWAGKRLRIGACTLQVYKPIGRCPNIDVDPDSGERKDEVFPHLKTRYGHSLTGMRAEIITPGSVRVGDDWELLE